MRSALVFGVLAAVVAGVAMAVTLASGHELDSSWWLPLAAAGAAGVAGFVLGGLGHLLTRTKTT